MKKIFLTTAFFIVLSVNVYSQEPVSLIDMSTNRVEAIYKPDKMPEFPGGQKALMRHISGNLKYPYEARKVQGRVIVKFVIDKEGKVKDAHVVKGVNKYLDAEALRVINKLPKWKPGEKDGKPVSVFYTIPVVFKISNPYALESDRPKDDIEKAFDSMNNRP